MQRPAGTLRYMNMGLGLRAAVAVVSLAGGLSLPAWAQGERCTHDTFTVDGTPIAARFCIPAGATVPALNVTETFSAAAKTMTKTSALTVVAGALTSRTMDDIDLRPLGPKRTLHITLAYQAGAVSLEHALALPGAIPIK